MCGDVFKVFIHLYELLYPDWLGLGLLRTSLNLKMDERVVAIKWKRIEL